MKFRLIALDLDGTLLTNNKVVSAANLYWIKTAEKLGIIVALATARGRYTSHQYWGVLSPTAPMILLNGAETWRNQNEVLHRDLIDPAIIPRLHRLALDYGAQYWAYVDDDYIQGGELYAKYSRDHQWLKFVISHPEEAVIDQIRQIALSMDDVGVTWSLTTNLEFVKPGVSKASGLAKVAEELGIAPSKIAVVGDNVNDQEMIKWAGLGVAMGNADPETKAVADYITLTNEENGVGKLIQLIIENRI